MSSSTSQPVDRLAIGAALVTVVLWASAFVGIRAVAVDLTPGSIASVDFGRSDLARPTRRRPGVGPAHPPRAGADRRVRARLVRGLQPRAQRGRAERRRGHRLDARQHRPDLHRDLRGHCSWARASRRDCCVGCRVAFVGTLIIGFASTSTPVGVGGNTPLGIALCFVGRPGLRGRGDAAEAGGAALPAHRSRGWRASSARSPVCRSLPYLVRELGTAAAGEHRWLVYLGLFPTAIGFTTWAFALSRTSAGRLGSMTYLVPPVVIVMAWLLLGEAPVPLAIVGGALCIAGVAVARSTRALLPRLRPSLRPTQAGAVRMDVGIECDHDRQQQDQEAVDGVERRDRRIAAFHSDENRLRDEQHEDRERQPADAPAHRTDDAEDEQQDRQQAEREAE